MNAIRRDEEMDNLHSIYVDQRDREKVITHADRTINFLKDIVQKIVHCICDTQAYMMEKFPALKTLSPLQRTVSFITAAALEEKYPKLSEKERENAYLKIHKTAFIMGISKNRAPDYDDRSLNGDIMFWSDILQCAVELSSMGIRVDAKSLDQQLKKSGLESRKTLEYHRALLTNKLPLTIGGGIGQSRLSMLIFGKVHIGEVQVSIRDQDTIQGCQQGGIVLL
jgi:aspartate--ammonia ligase